jgi:D-tagatose-1,6-bisphosphate aldolase subunit GatZ/KbaZ
VRARGEKRVKSATSELAALLEANRRGKRLGIYSICSANRFVLEAGMLQAARAGSLLLIEATSNQVNQFGGYTGQTPADFVAFVREIAHDMRFPMKRIILGGDHLGPQAWRNVTAATAMENARVMVADYVRAGFSKIHLDASMRCADDSGDASRPLQDEIVSTRAAELCQAAEEAYRGLPRGSDAPLYVIGTEVPIPGGEHAGAKAPEVSRVKDVKRTLDVAKRAFRDRGLNAAWERVVAVVVQPGVEFGDETVFPYEARKARVLARFITKEWTGVYEAHSTDYQTAGALRQMVQDRFAILKVGPWLTFAFREAVFALEAIEREWLSMRPGATLSCLQAAVEKAMVENPVYWKNYYGGDEKALRLARKYSYSDRVRYYWPQPAVTSALRQLIDNLTAKAAPTSLLSQYLPNQAEAVRRGELENRPAELIRHKILEVLNQYAYACGMQQGI